MGVKNRHLISLEEHRLGLYESRMPMKIFGVKNEEVIEGWRQLHNEMPKIDRDCATQEGIREVCIGFFDGKLKEIECLEDISLDV